jgi:hypothetical protein
MVQWVTNIITTDRDKPPDVIEGLYYTMAPIILFESITSQLTVARTVAEPKVFFYSLFFLISSLCMGY